MSKLGEGSDFGFEDEGRREPNEREESSGEGLANSGRGPGEIEPESRAGEVESTGSDSPLERIVPDDSPGAPPEAPGPASTGAQAPAGEGCGKGPVRSGSRVRKTVSKGGAVSAKRTTRKSAGEAQRQPRPVQWLYDPTRLEMLQSHERQDVPPASPFHYHSGTRHPGLQDLESYLQPPESGALSLPATVPLLSRPGEPPQNRFPHYGLSLTWQNPQRCTHLLVLGKTGSGKNTRVIDLARYSALSDRSQTVISVSLKSSDYGPIKIACDRAGKRCLVVNFENDRRSQGFNPLQHAAPNEAPDIIRRLADSSRNPRSGESEFWTQMLRTGMLALYEGGVRSFPDMFRFFSQSRTEILERLGDFKNPHARKLYDFLAGSSWNADTAEATIVGAFVPFQVDSVQRVMSRDELKLDRLFEEPVCLHIEVNEATLETSLPLVQMLLRTVIDKLIATAQRLGAEAIPATIFIDDLPSLGQVFSVERLLTLRSRQVGVVAGCQSIGALYHAFPNAGPALLEAFANQIVLPGCSAEDAEYFSRASGQQLVSIAGPAGQVPQFLTVPLLSPSDIRSPGYQHYLLGKPLTFLLGDIAFQAYLQHSFEIPQWREILREAAGITGTEPLRSRRLPNHFLAAEQVRPERSRRRRKRAQMTLPFHDSESANERWSDAEFAKAIRLGLEHLKYQDAFAWIQEWWDRFVKMNRGRERGILKLLSELIALDSTASEYYYAFTHSKSRDAVANLAFIAFCKATEAGTQRERKRKEKGPAGPAEKGEGGIGDLLVPDVGADQSAEDDAEWDPTEWELLELDCLRDDEDDEDDEDTGEGVMPF